MVSSSSKKSLTEQRETDVESVLTISFQKTCTQSTRFVSVLGGFFYILLCRRRLLKPPFDGEGKVPRDAWRNRVEPRIVSRADALHSPKGILHAFSSQRRLAHYPLIPVHVCKNGALEGRLRPHEQFHAGSMHFDDPLALVAFGALGEHAQQREKWLDELEVG